MKIKFLLSSLTLGVLLAACSTDTAVDPVTPAATAKPSTVAVQPADDLTLEGFGDVSVTDDRVDPRIRLELMKLTRILQLTERQQAAVLEILKKKYEMQRQIMLKFDNPILIRRALAQLQERVDHAIMKLLTREQLMRWLRWKRSQDTP